MSQTQIRGNKQIRSGSITNTEIASDANIALSKIAGGTELNNRVTDLESDAFVTREVPSGSVNGSNVTFTLANTPVAGSEQVYLNGLLQDPGAGNSYTIVGSTITFLSPPLTNDEIHVSYATGDYMVAPGGAGGGISPFQWSNAEQVYPFELGPNGETVYAIKKDIASLPASAGEHFYGLFGTADNTKVISIFGIARQNGNTSYDAFNIPVGSGGVAHIVPRIYQGQLAIIVGTNYSGYSATIKLLYIK